MDMAMIDDKITELRRELDTAEAELAKARARVQYLEAMLHRIDGALTVLQGLKEDDAKATVIATPVNHSVPVPVGA